jgi:hypothetical protein
MGNEWGDFRDIVQTADGDLVATGRVSAPSSNELWVVKFGDAGGAVLWQRVYRGTEGDWGSRTIELTGGDLLIGGVWAFGFAGEDIWIQRTDGYGSIPSCDLIQETAVVPVSPEIMVLPAVTTISEPTPLPVAIHFVSDVSNLSVDEKCRDVTGVEDEAPPSPRAARFTVNPNPVREAAIVAFRLEDAGGIRLDLLDASGRRVATLADQVLPAGEHRVVWNGPRNLNLPGGVYFLTLSSGRGSIARRAVVVR